MTDAEALAHHLTLRPFMPDASDKSVSLEAWVKARKALETWADHRDRLVVRVEHPDLFVVSLDPWKAPIALPKIQEKDVPADFDIDVKRRPVRSWNQVRAYGSEEERLEARRRAYRESKRRAAAEARLLKENK